MRISHYQLSTYRQEFEVWSSEAYHDNNYKQETINSKLNQNMRNGLRYNVGKLACEHARAVRENCALLGETAVRGLVMLVKPRQFRFGDCALAFERAGFDGLPITTLVGLLLGLILAFESAASLKMFGVEVYVADLIAIGLFRELGPLVTAIILAGRSGSAFAAEIGTMKVDEELDALTSRSTPTPAPAAPALPRRPAPPPRSPSTSR